MFDLCPEFQLARCYLHVVRRHVLIRHFSLSRVVAFISYQFRWLSFLRMSMMCFPLWPIRPQQIVYVLVAQKWHFKQDSGLDSRAGVHVTWPYQ